MWRIEFHASLAINVVFLGFLGLIPFGSSLLHRERPRELGFRLDNFARSARDTAIVTAAGAVIIVAIGLAAGRRPDLGPNAAIAVLSYLLWGLLQQYALQAFVYRRLGEGLRRSRTAAAVTAVLFGALHLPNPVLAPATVVVGYLWCRLYSRTPNLLTLAVSHAVLAALIMASLPPEWIHRLKVGPGYWS